MTIREAFDTINPTIEQKNRIYERLCQNAYAQSGIKRQMIRYVSAAAALVAVTCAAAAGATFALQNNGAPIDVSFEGSNVPETPYYTTQTTPVSTTNNSSEKTPMTTLSETAPPTSETTADSAVTTAPQTESVPTDNPSENFATNVTLRMKGSDAYLQKSLLYYLKVDDGFVTGTDIYLCDDTKLWEYPYFNTDGSDYTFDSIECGTYIIAGPGMSSTSEDGFAVFAVSAGDSGEVIELDLNKAVIGTDRVQVVAPPTEETDKILTPEEQAALVFPESIEYDGYKYLLCKTSEDYFYTGTRYSDNLSADGLYREILYAPSASRIHIQINGYDLSQEDIKQGVIICKHHVPPTGDCDHSKPYVREDICKKIDDKQDPSKMKILATNEVNDSILVKDAFYTLINIYDTGSALVLKDKNGAPIKNETLYMIYLDEIEKYDLSCDKILSEKGERDSFKTYSDCLITDKNGKIINSYYGTISSAIDEDKYIAIYKGTAVAVRIELVSDSISYDDSTVYVFDISEDGFKLTGEYPLKLFEKIIGVYRYVDE